MAKNLLIVESPSKAKTIEKYLGKDFVVKSTVGHIRDLDSGEHGVDIENNFEPRYIIDEKKRKVVSELKKALQRDIEVWLATDDDREGEAIAWHVAKVLKLDEEKTKRITFREITKDAIQNAIANPTVIDKDLVNAQQARRVLDRLVGFELSPVLWRKIKTGLSAGRVQSVALKLVAEREREIENFEAESFYRIQAIFDVIDEKGQAVELKATYNKRLDDKKTAEEFLSNCITAIFNITDIKVEPKKRYPTAPFITSTLQQEASRKYGMTPKRTMSAAQSLYEMGLITYMRTDSTNLSEHAIYHIGEWIKSEYGKKYHHTRRYKGKKKGAQEAHEAIRPTDISKKSIKGNRDVVRLYDLIRKRTIASQMAPEEYEKTTALIGISTMKGEELRAEGEVLIFDGFKKVYTETLDDDEKREPRGMLPPLNVGQELALNVMQAVQSFTRPPARYSQASLVKELESKEIGRPSTYAPTISKIMDAKRGYIVEDSKPGVDRSYNVIKLSGGEITTSIEVENTGATKKRLYATDLGLLVTDFLEEHFTTIMDYGFTADIEKKFDIISDGKLEWRSFLAEFYSPFHENVKKTLEEADRATGERVLGKHPKTGKTVLTRMTRNGPVVQIGKPEELEEEEKPQYASLLKSQSINTISYEEAMELFKLPKSYGVYKDMDVIVNNGPYGPYIKFGKKNISIPKGIDPFHMSEEEVHKVIDDKLKEEEPIGYYKDKPIQKGVGRYGPFVKWNGKFYSIPKKKYDPDMVDESTAIVIIEERLKRDAEKIIQEWPDLKITVENGRWGPFIRFGKENIRFPQKDKKKVSREEAAELSLEEIKKIIIEKVPDAFDGKGKKGKKVKKGKRKTSTKKSQKK